MRVHRRFKTVVSVTISVAALLMTGTAWAQATKQFISFQVASAVITDPGEVSVTGKVQHILGQQLLVVLGGDLQGTSAVVVDTHLNQQTGRGTVHGCFTGFDLEGNPTFDGCFTGQIDLNTGVQSGQVLAQGVKGTPFEGQVFVGTFQGPVANLGAGMVIQGTVTTPPGR